MITIKEVKSIRDSKRFTEFPNQLYKNVEAFVPPLSWDERRLFNKKVNPAHEYVDSIRFLAIRDKKIVGRIAGLINHDWNKTYQKKYARFTRIDMIDDIEVTKALISAVTAWAKTNGMDTLIGPIGFNDLDRQGMLVDGFEHLNMFITIYNFPYYHKHLEALGFTKDADWIEKKIQWPTETPEKIVKVTEIVRKRYGFKLIKLKNKRELKHYIPEVFKIYNIAFNELYGFYPVSDKVRDYYIKQFLSVVQLNYLWIVKDNEDEIAGFGLVIPSLAKAAKRSNGKLLPFGWLRMLRALKKYESLEFFFVAVLPKHQNKGLFALMLEDGFKEGILNNVKFAETGPELENNHAIVNQWKDYDYINHKRRRCYIKSI